MTVSKSRNSNQSLRGSRGTSRGLVDTSFAFVTVHTYIHTYIYIHIHDACFSFCVRFLFHIFHNKVPRLCMMIVPKLLCVIGYFIINYDDVIRSRDLLKSRDRFFKTLS